MSDLMIVGQNFARINGVHIELKQVGRSWVAQWRGSDGVLVRIERTSRKKLLLAIEPTMQHRRRVLGVQY